VPTGHRLRPNWAALYLLEAIVNITGKILVLLFGLIFGIAEAQTYRYMPELGATSRELDIYTFDGALNAPVMVYIHGGGKSG